MRLFFFLLIILNNAVFAQSANKKLSITHLTGDFYIYTTYGDPGNGSLFPANGMYLVTGKGAVIFDTPWDTTQFQPLLDSIQAKHHQKVVACIATHFHEDRTAGLNYYSKKGIQTYTGKQTDELSMIKHEPRAQYLIYKDTVFHVAGYSFETYYPGKGHSPDNIVIWFGKEKILYGGCFIKSTETQSIGNLSDADVNEWAVSIRKLQQKYPNPIYVIPGHQDWTNNQSLSHTLRIVKDYQDKQKNGHSQ